MVRYGTASRWHETLDRDARFPSNGSPAEYIERAFRSERDLSRPRCSSSTSAAHSPRNLDVDIVRKRSVDVEWVHSVNNDTCRNWVKVRR